MTQSKKTIRSSRRRMANRWRSGFRHQQPGFKLVWNAKTEQTEYKPNRAKTRQALALKRRYGAKESSTVSSITKEKAE